MNRREALRALGAGAATGALVGGVVMMTIPSPATAAAEPISAELAAAIARHRAALAEMGRLGEIQGDQEEDKLARPSDVAARAAFAAADEAFVDACGREQEAHRAVLAAPVLTLADMQAKAAYLASVSRHMIHDGETMTLLLASMSGKPVALPETGELDPLLTLVRQYEDGLARFDAYPSEAFTTETKDGRLQAATWEPHYRVLCEGPPASTTLAGALAGIRLVLNEEETCGHHEDFTINTLRAALAYFDGRA